MQKQMKAAAKKATASASATAASAKSAASASASASAAASSSSSYYAKDVAREEEQWKAPEYDVAQDMAVIVCPVCTYHNPISATNCEMCGSSLEPDGSGADGFAAPSRYIQQQQQNALKVQIKKNKAAKKGIKEDDKDVQREVQIGGDGRIKVVQKSQEDVKKENLKKKQQDIAAIDEDSSPDDSDDDFMKRARKLNESKKLKVGGDFTAQFTGNGKLNPAAEAAIKEQNDRERAAAAEREAKEAKAAKKRAKKEAAAAAAKAEAEAEAAAEVDAAAAAASSSSSKKKGNK